MYISVYCVYRQCSSRQCSSAVIPLFWFCFVFNKNTGDEGSIFICSKRRAVYMQQDN